jgi:hypothetical protein
LKQRNDKPRLRQDFGGQGRKVETFGSTQILATVFMSVLNFRIAASFSKNRRFAAAKK